MTGRGSRNLATDIKMTYKTLKADKNAALVGFHAFTGCDQTSKFCRKSKLTRWKVLTKVLTLSKDLKSSHLRKPVSPDPENYG